MAVDGYYDTGTDSVGYDDPSLTTGDPTYLADDATIPELNSSGAAKDNGDGTYNFDVKGVTYTVDSDGKILEQHDSSGRSTAGLDTKTPGGATDSGGIMSGLKEFSTWAKANPDTMRLVGGLGMASLPLLGKMFPGLGNALNPQQGNPNVYQGGINMNMQANRQQLGGRNAQGRYMTDVQYSTPQAPVVQKAEGGEINGQPMQENYTQGGIMVGYARGGVAHGRYLQGTTDGMADKLPAHIDGKQPAKLSHGEFVVPADVVSHLGNGNSDAGAQKLYSMMDKIRMARTGTKKQGKQINPDKYMPKFASGGVVGFAEGGSTVPTGATGVTQGLNTTFGPYVTNMLGQANALADSPYQAYQGPLTAGASNLQQQGFSMASNLAPSQYTDRAAQAAGGIGAEALGSSYSPTQYGSTYQGTTNAYQPQTYSNAFQAPTGPDTQATNFTNQFTAPGAYQGSNISSGIFGTQEAQQYMNPYIQQALNPQLDEMRRQSQITQMQNDAKMVGAGAFGGSRQALMTTENQRNMSDQMRNALGTGYKNAYDAAAQQFNADQGRGLAAQQANEQSRQFGANQSMTAAQLQAQYGMSAQQAQEAARQFNQNQAMTGAQNAAQYGQAANQLNSQNQQFGANYALQNAQNAAQYGQAANQLSNQDKQFGANYGIQGLNTALNAAQLQGSMGAQQNQQGIANLNAVLGAGATQRDITSQGIAADQAAFNAERDNPYKMLQFKQSMLQGMPIAATDVSSAQPSLIQQLASMGALGGSFSDWLTGTGTTSTNKA